MFCPSIQVLARVQSDHHPILIEIEGSRVKKSPQSCQYLDAWPLDDRYKTHISSIWTSPLQDITHLLHLTKKKFSFFNKQVFGNITTRKQNMEKRIPGIHYELSRHQSQTLLQLESISIQSWENYIG